MQRMAFVFETGSSDTEQGGGVAEKMACRAKHDGNINVGAEYARDRRNKGHGSREDGMQSQT
eukprot:1278191-Pleurochrysis_carterae.AAC.1